MTNADPELNKVIAKLREIDPKGEKIAAVLRATLDQLYDGLHTGRYRWDQLHKTEKTHCGTLVEINLHREFQFADGQLLDYRIEGVEIDCKYSQTIGGWMIPPETEGHLCMLISANDEHGLWSLGVIRITNSILSKGGNRDLKRSITASGKEMIRWVFKDQSLPPNVLLHLERATVERIMKLKSGQQRVNEIFRVAQRRRIGRGVVATLGQQNDYMKRVRGNGGARSKLKSEGIIILGHFREHQQIAQSLGVPVPQRGELVSVRIVPSSLKGSSVAKIHGGFWRVATTDDPITPAPDCPHR